MTSEKINWFRPRVLAYSALFLISMTGLFWGLNSHSDVNVLVMRSKGSPYQLLEIDSKKVLQNQYFVRIQNNSKSVQNVFIKTPENFDLKLPQNPIAIPKGAHLSLPFFIHYNAESFSSNGSMDVMLEIHTQDKVVKQKVQLIGPKQ